MSHPLCFYDGVNTITQLFRQPAQQVCNLISRLWPAPPAAASPAELGDHPRTVDGLPLRDALAVRSAEFWLALGEPRLALREFESLTELARQNAWAQRVHECAQTAAHPDPE